MITDPAFYFDDRNQKLILIDFLFEICDSPPINHYEKLSKHINQSCKKGIELDCFTAQHKKTAPLFQQQTAKSLMLYFNFPPRWLEAAGLPSICVTGLQ